ncbi:hypothetical protein LEP1GSC021_2597 [Leptospira noguchii str. 1993005606]|uniref:Uncharacterized protein n=1 Tax=Leptospira noguchii str. 2001034031 TaxID=1193053 RepID=M6YTK4_9LEPT|nr:hypothetical protein LEP1GSC024_0032 [Leptospira noguchii str. 2001034031]EPE84207.1 hypothetical protein LEP1GSC021_2597 [Leptospira noguchii str. 1993005606]
MIFSKFDVRNSFFCKKSRFELRAIPKLCELSQIHSLQKKFQN